MERTLGVDRRCRLLRLPTFSAWPSSPLCFLSTRASLTTLSPGNSDRGYEASFDGIPEPHRALRNGRWSSRPGLFLTSPDPFLSTHTSSLFPALGLLSSTASWNSGSQPETRLQCAQYREAPEQSIQKACILIRVSTAGKRHTMTMTTLTKENI